MADQRSQTGSDFFKILREAVLGAAAPQPVQRGVVPTAAFAISVAIGQCSQRPLRAAGSRVVLASSEFVASFVGVKSQQSPLGIEPHLLGPVLRLETREHPGFAFYNSQPDEDDWRSQVFAPSLLESVSTFPLVVLIAEQNDCGEVIQYRLHVQNGTPRCTGVGFKRLSVDVAVGFDPQFLGKGRDSFPSQPLPGGVRTNPLPLIDDEVFV